MIIIVAPPYDGASGGCRALYDLAIEINSCWSKNFEAKIAVFIDYPAFIAIEEDYRDYYATIDDIVEAVENGYVLYPEIISGNPIRSKRVIRYIMNVPGKLYIHFGDLKSFDGEIKIAYNQELSQYSDGETLTVPIIEPFFSNEGLKRSGALLWVGKGKNDNMIKGATEITKHYPKDRKQLAKMLNEAQILYTYDDFTMLTNEAILCGCKVILRKDGKETEIKTTDYFEGVKQFPEQLERFLGRLK